MLSNSTVIFIEDSSLPVSFSRLFPILRREEFLTTNLGPRLGCGTSIVYLELTHKDNLFWLDFRSQNSITVCYTCSYQFWYLCNTYIMCTVLVSCTISSQCCKLMQVETIGNFKISYFAETYFLAHLSLVTRQLDALDCSVFSNCNSTHPGSKSCFFLNSKFQILLMLK